MNKRLAPAILFLAILISACQAIAAPQRAGDEFFAGEPPAAVEVAAEAEFVESRAGGFADTVSAQVERIVIKNANLSIVVPDPGEAMSTIALMAEDMGGFVVSSNLFQTEIEGGLEVPRGSITIRVPAERLNDALAEIEGSASRVISKNESGEDVTREYTDLQSRLRNLEEAETQLREILASATKTEDVLSVFNQLTQVREQIEVIQGQIQFFEQSARFSAISIELIADAAVQPLTIGRWQPVGVARDSIQALLNTLTVLANAAIWLILYLLPVLIVIAIPLAIVWRVFRRWRRGRAKVAEPVQPTSAGTE